MISIKKHTHSVCPTNLKKKQEKKRKETQCAANVTTKKQTQCHQALLL